MSWYRSADSMNNWCDDQRERRVLENKECSYFVKIRSTVNGVEK